MRNHLQGRLSEHVHGQNSRILPGCINIRDTSRHNEEGNRGRPGRSTSKCRRKILRYRRCLHSSRRTLDEGILDSYEVECPWHGSRFDLRTGDVKEGPAGNPEPTYEVRIDGENILVRAK